MSARGPKSCGHPEKLFSSVIYESEAVKRITFSLGTKGERLHEKRCQARQLRGGSGACPVKVVAAEISYLDKLHRRGIPRASLPGILEDRSGKGGGSGGKCNRWDLGPPFGALTAAKRVCYRSPELWVA